MLLTALTAKTNSTSTVLQHQCICQRLKSILENKGQIIQVISFDSCYKLSTSFIAGKSCDIFDNCYKVSTALTAVIAVTAKIDFFYLYFFISTFRLVGFDQIQLLQVVDGFDSCNKLLTALTAVTSY